MIIKTVLYAQLEAFVEIARKGNMSRAAEALYVSQPALTARMRSLEDDVGSQLLTRTGRGMRPTAAGVAFLPYATRALESIAQGRNLLMGLERGEAGELIVGASPAISTYVLPAALRAFSRTRPAVELRVRTGHSEDVLALVSDGEVEIGLARQLSHEGIDQLHLYDDELVLITRADHPLAERSTIVIMDLAQEQLILFDRSSSYHELTGALFRRAGVTPRAVMELDNIDATKKMVAQGLGVAFLPRAAVDDELATGTLATTAISDAEPLRRPIVAMTRSGSGPLSGPAQAFLALLLGLDLPGVAANR